jgi:hypothetical protein
LIDQEARERLLSRLEGVADDRYQRIVRGLVLEDRPLQEIAAELGVTAGGRAFRGLVREALSLVLTVLPPESAHGETDEAGGEA